MWPFTRKQKREPEYNQFIEQIKQIHKIETDSDKLYIFCLGACHEIHKHTGNFDWHEKLDQILKSQPATYRQAKKTKGELENG